MSKQLFTITQQHIFLLQSACLRWDDCEFGAPGIDPKRPYGNSSALRDIAEILNIQPEGEDGEFSLAQHEYMTNLHEGTLTVLQIILDTGEVKPGTYTYEGHGNWQHVEEKEPSRLLVWDGKGPLRPENIKDYD